MPVQNTTKFPFQGQTILIVDDNPINLGVVSDYLEDYGFEIMVARSGENALKRIQHIQPDIILLDIMMPGMDGFETCQQLKANKVTKDIPVIFMTALTGTEDKVRGFEVGAVDYITKPIHQEEVLARVRTHLNLRNLTQNLQMQNLRLETSSQVGRQIISILELDKLLIDIVTLIQNKFGYYFVGIWLLTEQKDGLVIQASYGSEQTSCLESGYVIPLNTKNSILIWAYQNSQSYLVNDTNQDPEYLGLKQLPDTKSQLVLPLCVREDTIGVLDIQANQLAAFMAEDKTILQSLADQIAIAIRNAKLYKLEKKFRQAEEEKTLYLAKLNAAKDKFFSIVAHDLKIPFQPLLISAHLLSKNTAQLSPKNIQKMSTNIHNAAREVYSLLENLLQWSQMQRGQITHYPFNLNLNQIVQQNINLFALNAKNKAIVLQSTVVTDIIVYADENMLDTIIRNLISNALKFTPTDGTVTIASKPITPQVKFIEVSISDTGVGISEENLAKLFKIEDHHSTQGTAQEQGTGLGLIICQEMIEQNGGKLWIESQIGKGTTVKFTLPSSHPS